MTKKLPDNWWDLGINPIVGFRIPKASEGKNRRIEVELYAQKSVSQRAE